MNDREKPPSQFANHVIKQMAAHMLTEDMKIEANDYMVMRTAFRSCGGMWTEISAGNIVHLELLKNVVTAWGNMPGREMWSNEAV